MQLKTYKPRITEYQTFEYEDTKECKQFIEQRCPNWVKECVEATAKSKKRKRA